MTYISLVARQSTAPATGVLIADVTASINAGTLRFHTDGGMEWVDSSNGERRTTYNTFCFDVYTVPCGIGPNNL